MVEPVQDLVSTLLRPLTSFSQMLTQSAPQLEQLAPHNVLARIFVKPTSTPPPAQTPPSTPIPTHQTTNAGLYRQHQTVGQRARVGTTDDKGYATGLGDIAIGYAPAPSSTLSEQPTRVPSAVGLGDIAATNSRGFDVEELSPVVQSDEQFTLYAPKKVKASVF